MQNGFLTPFVLFSTAKLNRVIDYPADDMTILSRPAYDRRVEPTLAEKRQWLR